MGEIEAPARGESRRPTVIPRPKATAPASYSADRQRPEQIAEEPAIERQTRTPGDLDGRDQEGCAPRLRRLHRNLGHQIRQGGRVLDQGSRRAAAFYDFPAEHWKHLRTAA